MDKKIIMITGILFSLLLAGCAQEQDGPTPTEPFIGGTVGLNAYLLDGVPPDMIQDNGQSPFGFAVVLENLGEANVGVGTNDYFRLKLEGINPTTWGLPDDTSKSLPPPGILRGARKNFDGTILPGEVTTVSYENMNYQSDVKGNTEFVIRADMCYDYTTIATAQVCIKDDVLEHIQDDSICSLNGPKQIYNSGAPIHVTDFVQHPLTQNKIQVRFTVEHVGIGDFYGDPEFTSADDESCNPSPSNFNRHKVFVVLEPLSSPDYTVNCPRLAGSNAGTITLDNGQQPLEQGELTLFQGAPQTITCTVERTGPSQGRIFQDILEIQLHYRYGQFIETPILVQDVTNEPGAEFGP